MASVAREGGSVADYHVLWSMGQGWTGHDPGWGLRDVQSMMLGRKAHKHVATISGCTTTKSRCGSVVHHAQQA
jgi:hypothetical protein